MVIILMAIHLVIRLGINGYGMTVSHLLPIVRFGQPLHYAHKRIVNILKVYIERNTLQLELIRYSKPNLTLFTFTVPNA